MSLAHRIAVTIFALVVPALSGSLMAATDPSAVLRFAVLGDAEPKPEPLFPGVEAAVRDVNAMAATGQIDFVVGVGDLAHKGTVVQYDNLTPILKKLSRPFWPIMGNEEHNSSKRRFLKYAREWNPEVTATRYVRDEGPVVMIFASPDFSREFSNRSIDWILSQVKAAAPKPVFLVVHAAQAGVYPESAEKGVKNPRFVEIVAQPNLTAVISGDLHMDMDRTVHSRQVGHVHYLHMPALERTKIPDETHHVPMFRVLSVTKDGEVQVDTFQTGSAEPLERHAYRFKLP